MSPTPTTAYPAYERSALHRLREALARLFSRFVGVLDQGSATALQQEVEALRNRLRVSESEKEAMVSDAEGLIQLFDKEIAERSVPEDICRAPADRKSVV